MLAAVFTVVFDIEASLWTQYVIILSYNGISHSFAFFPPLLRYNHQIWTVMPSYINSQTVGEHMMPGTLCECPSVPSFINHFCNKSTWMRGTLSVETSLPLKCSCASSLNQLLHWSTSAGSRKPYVRLLMLHRTAIKISVKPQIETIKYEMVKQSFSHWAELLKVLKKIIKKWRTTFCDVAVSLSPQAVSLFNKLYLFV